MYKTSKETYNTVFKACKGMCVLCSKKRDLQLHHIDGRGKYLTNNVRNCVMLCRECHNDVVHDNLKKYRPMLKEIAEVIYG